MQSNVSVFLKVGNGKTNLLWKICILHLYTGTTCDGSQSSYGSLLETALLYPTARYVGRRTQSILNTCYALNENNDSHSPQKRIINRSGTQSK